MNNKAFLALIVLFLLATNGYVLAGTTSTTTITLPNPLCPGGSGSSGCVDSFPTLITTITTYIFTLIAGLAVIMFLWAGILFVTSAGSEQKVTSARKALFWAVVGTAIALTGQGLVAVITAVIGAP